MRRFSSAFTILVVMQTCCACWVVAAEVYVDASHGDDKQDGLQVSPVGSPGTELEFAL